MSATPDSPAAWSRLADQVALQDWPTGTLYVVATPIGNLGDLSLRAAHALRLADVIAAEDTRSSRPLLDAWGITTPLMAAHRHNEASAAAAIVARLAAGERVALISDAGAPGVSDPGARVIRAAIEAGHRVIPLPGPSAVITALMACGATSDEQPGYAFAGFAPSKRQARQSWLRPWCALPVAVVLYESPHRLADCVDDLLTLCGPTRQLTIARELTKRFETVVTLPLGDVPAWLAADAHRQQGEVVLVLEGAPEAAEPGTAELDTVLTVLLEHLSVRDATRAATRLTGASRDAAYARALALRPTEP